VRYFIECVEESNHVFAWQRERQGRGNPKAEGRGPKEIRDPKCEWTRRLCHLPGFHRRLSYQRPLLLRARGLGGVGFLYSVGQAGTGRAHVRIARESVALFGDRLTTTHADARLHSTLRSTTITRAARGYLVRSDKDITPGGSAWSGSGERARSSVARVGAWFQQPIDEFTGSVGVNNSGTEMLLTFAREDSHQQDTPLPVVTPPPPRPSPR